MDLKDNIRQKTLELLVKNIVRVPFKIRVSYGTITDVEEHFDWVTFWKELKDLLSKFKCYIEDTSIFTNEREDYEEYLYKVTCEDGSKFNIKLELWWSPNEIWDKVKVKEYSKLSSYKVEVL